jgi:hypothetical protein
MDSMAVLHGVESVWTVMVVVVVDVVKSDLGLPISSRLGILF